MTPDQSATAVALPSAIPSAVDRSKPDVRLLGLLALGHMIVDINQGSLAAILPAVKSALALSYTATGIIVLVASTTSSLIQSVFGYLVRPFTVSVVLGQACMPRHPGMASGMIMGFVMPLAAFAAALFLPEPRAAT